MARIKPKIKHSCDFEMKAKANGFRFVFGVDEAGRGPLAGPVVAAAVALKEYSFHHSIADSKKLTPLQREKAFLELHERSWYGIGIMSENVIDEINILKATHLAMVSAVNDLVTHLPADERAAASFNKEVLVLVDGNSFQGDLPFCVKTIVEGDRQCLSISAASIIAKVYRDRLIGHYDRIYPQYGFRTHKGYPTVAHREAIKKHGPSPIHRKSFRHF